MKKVTLMLTALALVLGISQCKKQEQPVQAGEKQYIELTADNGNDGSKVGGSFSAATMNLFWEEGDVITVSGGATGTLTLDGGAGTSQGHFSGEITLDSRADLVFTWTKLEEEPDFNDQTGTQDWIIGNLVLEAKTAYNESGKYSLKMEMPYAVLKLNLRALVGESGNDVGISAGSGAVATVKSLAKASSNEVYVAVPELGENTYIFSGNGKSVDKAWTLEANTYYTAGTDGAAIEIKPFLFSVAEGVTVEFAPANLYWDGIDSKWKFEANQWSFPNTWDWDASHVNFIKWSDEANAVTDDFDYSGDLFCASNFTVAGDSHTWRTLSIAEWLYLLNTRDNASSLWALVTLTDVSVLGLVILPDGSSATASGITTSSALASSGAVFLPAAGRRYGTEITQVGWGGNYWSTTPDYESGACFMKFGLGDVGTDFNTRYHGYSIRLVR